MSNTVIQCGDRQFGITKLFGFPNSMSSDQMKGIETTLKTISDKTQDPVIGHAMAAARAQQAIGGTQIIISPMVSAQ